jgi:hypothetical protein
MDKKDVDKLLKASNRIHQASINGTSNIIFCGSHIAEQLEQLEEDFIVKNREKNIDDVLNEKNDRK